MSERFRFRLVIGVALVYLLGMALAPWASFLGQPGHSHIGSPAVSDNSYDVSFLEYSPAFVPDAALRICDRSSFNDRKALGRAFRNGYVRLLVDDQNGANEGCYRAFGSNPYGGHDACNWREDYSSCGQNSVH